ncbi:hypothetical protein [Halorussus salinisoli]|uniref:hypothetical protein n=1 Tax=Halorussus salinisoli TaxID=2558242 RepID=UPI0010C2140F|nr:hypothetical protein [Halorussus salinisoli]
MTDSTFRKGLAVWLSVFAILAVVGAVVAFGFLGLGRAPPPMDDLHVSNHDDANHTVRVEVVAANDSATTFEGTVTLSPGERVSFDGTTAYDREYRLLVAVDGRESESFDIEGPDDLCTTEVRVESSATIEVGTGCA